MVVILSFNIIFSMIVFNIIVFVLTLLAPNHLITTTTTTVFSKVNNEKINTILKNFCFGYLEWVFAVLLALWRRDVLNKYISFILFYVVVSCMNAEIIIEKSIFIWAFWSGLIVMDLVLVVWRCLSIDHT